MFVCDSKECSPFRKHSMPKSASRLSIVVLPILFTIIVLHKQAASQIYDIYYVTLIFPLRHVTVQTFRSDMDDVHSMSSNSTRAQVRDAKGLPADFQRFRFYPSIYSFVNQVVQNRLISNTRQPIGAVGLMNLGNTCFMNAALQCLFNCTPLTDYFLGIYWEDEVNSDNVLGHKGEMVKAYARLLESLWSSNSSSVRNPSAFKHTVGSIMPMFSGNEQHDVHEFVAFMLDAMHEDLNRVKGKKPYIKRSEWREEEDEEITARKAWKGYLLRNRSIIVDLFQGQLRSQLRCLYCGYVSVTFDPFMYLSVPLLKADLKKSITLQQCLEYFCEEEALDDKEQWFCPMCKCSVPSVKKFDLWKLPSVLIIHFKRFVYDNKRRRCRNNVNVSFPISSLDLSCFVKSYQREPPHYDLFAVANHHGGKISSGHYTAQTLSRVTNEWNNFNDSNVQPVCASKVSSSNEKAYVLFYSKMRPGMSVKGETTPAKKLKRKYGDNSSRSGRNDAQHRKMGIIRRQSLSKPQDWPHESN